MASSPQSDPIADLLKRSKTIAVVGLSCNPLRPSHGVSAYMQSHGYRIIPVNPQIEECLGEKAYASLLDVPEKIDIVNIFRRPEFVEEIVDQAIQLKVPAIWMQEDVIHEKAAEKARQAGIFVVMDRCILKEHRARCDNRLEYARESRISRPGDLRDTKLRVHSIRIYRPTPTNTTLASSRKPAPLAKARTSSTMLTADAPGFAACSASRHRPYSSPFGVHRFGNAVAVEDQSRSLATA